MTLHSQTNWLRNQCCDPSVAIILVAVRIYGITIFVHENNAEHVYQFEEDCPIIHVVRMKSIDERDIYLATEKSIDDVKENISEMIDINAVNEYDEGNNNEDQRYSNLIIRTVKPDGNCYFRALSDQISGSQDGHIVLRTIITDFISDNREAFDFCFDQEHFPSWTDFIHRMHQQGTFADGTVLAASAIFLRRSIIVHQREQYPQVFKPSMLSSNDNRIHIIYYCRNLHYDSLLSIDGKKLYMDESQCILV